MVIHPSMNERDGTSVMPTVQLTQTFLEVLCRWGGLAVLVRKWANCSCTNNDKTHSFPWSTLTSSHSPYSTMRGLLGMIKHSHCMCVPLIMLSIFHHACLYVIYISISGYMHVWSYLNKFAYISTLFFTGIDMKPTILLLKPSIAAMCVTPNITSFSFWSMWILCP